MERVAAPGVRRAGAVVAGVVVLGAFGAAACGLAVPGVPRPLVPGSSSSPADETVQDCRREKAELYAIFRRASRVASSTVDPADPLRRNIRALAREERELAVLVRRLGRVEVGPRLQGILEFERSWLGLLHESAEGFLAAYRSPGGGGYVRALRLHGRANELHTRLNEELPFFDPWTCAAEAGA